jgi:hypothetical protein
MAGRAVLFALTDDETSRILDSDSDEALVEIVNEIQSRWDTESLCELDKAWDGIHRCLTNGELEWTGGEYPLNHAILGGRRLYDGDDHIVVYVAPQQVADVAAALRQVNEEDLRRRYQGINREDYEFSVYDDDEDYVAGWFEPLPAFYAKAAWAGRPVIFTVAW